MTGVSDAAQAREMNKVTRCRGFDKCVKDRVKWRAHAAGLEAADGQDQEGEGLWQRFSEVFDWLPMAAIVNDKIFCVHGGEQALPLWGTCWLAAVPSKPQAAHLTGLLVHTLLVLWD